MQRETALVDLMRAEFELPVRGITHGGRGALGEIWRLQVEGRPDLAVKLLTDQPSESLVANEVAHTRRMAGHGVAVAAGVADRHGRYVTAGAGGWVRVSEWVDGTAPDPADPLTPPRLGEVLGRMHAHAESAPRQVSGWYSKPPPTARLEELVAAAEKGDPRWGGRLEVVVPNLRRLSEITKEPKTKVPSLFVWCHRDLHPGTFCSHRRADSPCSTGSASGPPIPARSWPRCCCTGSPIGPDCSVPR